MKGRYSDVICTMYNVQIISLFTFRLSPLNIVNYGIKKDTAG